MPNQHRDTLKENVLAEAFDVIEEHGVEKLSLRDIARRLGVSHQAPYKHFSSRDHILAAVVARCFEHFSDHLQQRPAGKDPYEDLGRMGLAYLDFAATHPLKYRLMFNTPLPPSADHPEMLEKAQHALQLLQTRLDTMELRDACHAVKNTTKHDAIFIWSALHGFASLMQSDVTETAGLTQKDKGVALERLMRRLSLAIEP